MEDNTAHFSRLPGGRYRARQNEDGTWDVLGVPVFSVVPKGIKGAPHDITEDHLKSAVELHGRMFREDKHLARLNVLHNFGTHKASGAGFFLPKEVRPFRMKGQTRPAIFADLLSVKDEFFQALSADDLPYCSVEIREWEPLQFGALALLDTEPPFFEFPLITVEPEGVVSIGADVTRFQQHPQEPALAAFVSGTGSRVLFRFGAEDDMPDDEKKKDEDENVEAKFEEGEESEDGLNADAIVKAIEDGSITVADMEAITAAIAARTGAVEEEEAPIEEAEVVEDVSDQAPVEFSASDVKTSARLAVLEDFKAQTVMDKANAASFSAALKTLTDEGHALGDRSQDRLRTAVEEGEKTLGLVMAIFREEVPVDPPESFDGIFRGGPDTTLPEEVTAYEGEGPATFAEAKRVHMEYVEMKAAFGANPVPPITPLDRYLARNVRKGG